ncbi:MAG: MFS transporter [Chloroflexi bacterium]|nr:MFS transporter [Chloroflexota bacterium]MCI0575610.1 MFS transporter [Chloroflexota bacterium]MCI0645053.1 MFS transporter [Chloroflexota bacterium]MCI0731889.1 MFS transporter [Chloroflexota bacterium]
MNEAPASRVSRLRAFFGLKRNISVLLVALVLLGLGEELWSSFVPKYLEALGTGVFVWTGYQALKDLLDAIYQYPGGILADRLGQRRALVLFNLLAILGYILYLVSRHWSLFLVGTLFVAAWSSMSLPATFSVIGDNLAQRRRTIGFSVQSILKRVPIVIAPAVGGWLLLHYGVIQGFHLGVLVTIALAAGALVFQQRFYREKPLARPPRPQGIGRTFRAFHPGLKRLLVSDILARLAEGLPAGVLVVYATTNLGATAAFVGSLRGLQMLTAILLYIPAGKLAERWGQGLFIALTFGFFTLFPLTFAAYPLFPGLSVALVLVIAFLFAGLREIGEPARKAMIVDLAGETQRGEVVGVYYLVRGLSVAGGPLLGGVLWNLSPQWTFGAAAALGLAGMLWYIWRGPKDVEV